jgi:8-oxo-dGTP diphosphatase
MTAELKTGVATRAIIIVDGNVLLGKREHGSGAGKFALIGGKIDEGETPEECIVREVREEVGLELKDPTLWKKITDLKSVPGENWTIYYFIGDGKGEAVLKEDENTEIVYANRRNFESLDLAFNHREILEEFFGLR